MRGRQEPATYKFYISHELRPKHPTKKVASTLGDGFVRTFMYDNRKLLVATDLVGAVSAKIGLEEGDLLKVVETFKGKDLVGIK